MKITNWHRPNHAVQEFEAISNVDGCPEEKSIRLRLHTAEKGNLHIIMSAAGARRVAKRILELAEGYDNLPSA